MKSVGYAEAVGNSRPKKMGPKVLRSIEIEKAEGGGHVLTHRFKQNDGPYHESEGPHVFGKSEGAKLMAHLKEHLDISGAGSEED